MKTFASSCFTFFIMSAISSVYAQVQLSGYFIARSECPAYRSFRNQPNSGNVTTKVNQAYDLIAKNKEQGTHYLIKMNEVPNQRWVATSCGEHVIPFDDISAPIVQPTDSAIESYLLAVSWQPGFCESHPAKPECEGQTENRFDASNFTLHGLWPQPRSKIYCDVAPSVVSTDEENRWAGLPALLLEDRTRAELNQVMPGSQSHLHRHQWIKHGTCYNGKTAESYYKDSLKLMSELNSSTVRNLFSANVGKEITSIQIIEAFNNAFGDGAGDKIKIACKNDGSRRLITEITINLKGDLNITLGDAILDADNANNPGCNKGIVDPVGLQ